MPIRLARTFSFLTPLASQPSQKQQTASSALPSRRLRQYFVAAHKGWNKLLGRWGEGRGKGGREGRERKETYPFCSSCGRHNILLMFHFVPSRADSRQPFAGLALRHSLVRIITAGAADQYSRPRRLTILAATVILCLGLTSAVFSQVGEVR